MKLRDAINLFPQLLDEEVKTGYSKGNQITPEEADFQFVGDGNYRTSVMTKPSNDEPDLYAAMEAIKHTSMNFVFNSRGGGVVRTDIIKFLTGETKCNQEQED